MKSMTFTKMVWCRLAVTAMALLGASTLLGQGQTGGGVARISLIHGDVSTQRGDSGDTAAAALNAPVVTGDRISTGDNSRAEVQLDYANILRLNERSQANVASLTDKDIQIQVGQGSATYTAFKTSEIRPEVDTTNLSVRPAKGDVSFRVEVVSPDETEVTVRNGEAEVSTSSGSTQVRKGQMIVVRGSGADAQYKVEEARGRDDWDKWNNDRDHVIRDAESVRRTSPYYTGSQDLDTYGHWSEIPDYGSVWVPTVSVDWVPYRDGRWVWEPYYGWTWVSSEPWGWAPYHYGRWFYSGASWVWWPGPVGGYGYGRGYYRPIWAPAYVSFFGFGGGVGIGFGSFGWLPIGPCDSFRPWWGGYGSRFNQVNVTNITNVTNIYNNGGRGDRFRGERPLYEGRGRQYSNLRLAGTDPHIGKAISSVPAEHFGNGRVAPRGIDPGSFRQARLMTGNLPVVPTRASLSASNKFAAPDTFRGGQAQRFFGTNRPAVSQSFEHQAQQVQQSIQRDGHFTPIRSGEPVQAGNNATGGRGSDHATLQGRGPNSQGSGMQGQRNQNPERGGFTPRETPVNPSTRGSDTRVGSSQQEGWHRFSGPNSGPASSGQASGPAGNRGGGVEPRNIPMNRGSVPQPESRPQSQGSGRDQSPARGSGSGPAYNGGGWQRFPSPANRDSAPVDRGGSGNNGRFEGPSNNGNGGWNRGSRPEPANTGNGGTNGRYQGPSSGGGGWDRGSRPEAPRGDYGRGGGRPTLDMRQPVVTPRSSQGPSYEPRGGGRSESPRPPSGGGGRSESPRPPSGAGGGHNGGGRPPGGERHR